MSDELFEGPETIGEVLAGWRRKALADVAALPSDSLLLTHHPDELEAEILERWRLNALDLDWDKSTSEAEEIQISNGTQPGEVTGTKVTLFVPFHGPPGLLHLRPPTPPDKELHGTIRGGETLLLNYSYIDADAATVKREVDHQVAAVKESISSINSDVDAYNTALTGLIHDALKARVDKLRAVDKVVAALGVPRRPRRTTGSGAIASPPRRSDANRLTDTEPHSLGPGDLPKPQNQALRTPRRAGRPKGPYLVPTRADIEKPYRKLWTSSGRRPFWNQVARELGVDERTLREARRSLGLDTDPIDKFSE